MTNITTDTQGQFSAVHPVPADAQLGPVLLETRFTGTLEYLPSANNGTWNIFSKIYVDVNIESPLAVEQLTTINGFVGDNMLNPLSGMLVVVTVEGITIGNATTDSNGNYSFNWQVLTSSQTETYCASRCSCPRLVPSRSRKCNILPSTSHRNNCQYR